MKPQTSESERDLLAEFPYRFFKFDPKLRDFEDVVSIVKAMRNETLEFFKNAHLTSKDGILFETLTLLSNPANLEKDNLRINNSLRIFYEPDFREQFGEICISNKFPTDASVDTSACKASEYWRMPYDANSFGFESLGVAKPNHRELKNLILQDRNNDKNFYAFISVGEANYDNAAFKLASTKYLKSNKVISYTLNPGTLTMFEGLSGLIIDDSLRQEGIDFLTNNCGSRFLSSCVRADPLIQVAEKIQRNIDRGAHPLPDMHPTIHKQLMAGDHGRFYKKP